MRTFGTARILRIKKIRGKKDGEVIIKNISPKLVGGKHEVVDETFNNNVSYKETNEGRLTE
ncbi:MAG: hypothetical protein FWG92_05160 [Leptospirales bacterium]|nr:hypothetical protein [Leptospirales bacterium]